MCQVVPCSKPELSEILKACGHLGMNLQVESKSPQLWSEKDGRDWKKRVSPLPGSALPYSKHLSRGH